jgi:hypothetical protein
VVILRGVSNLNTRPFDIVLLDAAAERFEVELETGNDRRSVGAGLWQAHSEFLAGTLEELERSEPGIDDRVPEVVVETAYLRTNAGRTYDVSPDGRRFLMVKSAASEQASDSRRIVLVQSWFDELRRLAPPRR